MDGVPKRLSGLSLRARADGAAPGGTRRDHGHGRHLQEESGLRRPFRRAGFLRRSAGGILLFLVSGGLLTGAASARESSLALLERGVFRAGWSAPQGEPLDVTEKTRASRKALAALKRKGRVIFEDGFETKASLRKWFEITGLKEAASEVLSSESGWRSVEIGAAEPHANPSIRRGFRRAEIGAPMSALAGMTSEAASQDGRTELVRDAKLAHTGKGCIRFTAPARDGREAGAAARFQPNHSPRRAACPDLLPGLGPRALSWVAPQTHDVRPEPETGQDLSNRSFSTPGQPP